MLFVVALVLLPDLLRLIEVEIDVALSVMLGIALSAVILFPFNGLIGESLGAGFVLPSIVQTVLLAILALLSVMISAALAAWIAGKKVNQMDASLVLKEGE